MNIEVLKPTTLKADAVRLRVPIRYEEDLQELIGCFGVVQTTLDLTIGLDSGVVEDWPAGKTASIHLKVVDEGTYELLGEDKAILASREENYVPGFFPGSHYGDYIILDICADGKVAGWRPKPDDVADAFDFGGGR